LREALALVDTRKAQRGFSLLGSHTIAAMRQPATSAELTTVPRFGSEIPGVEPAVVPNDVLPRGSPAPGGCVTTTLLQAPDCNEPDTMPVVLAEDPGPVPICETGRSAVLSGLCEP
jgi:hypothetical protein